MFVALYRPADDPHERRLARTIKKVDGANHYFEFIDACLDQGSTSAPFAYAGPLTEFVLLVAWRPLPETGIEIRREGDEDHQTTKKPTASSAKTYRKVGSRSMS